MKKTFMTRTQIYLEPGQQKVLRSVAKRQAKTVSQLIREAVGTLVAHYQKPPENKSSIGLNGIIGIYLNESDSKGSTEHDDIYD